MNAVHEVSTGGSIKARPGGAAWFRAVLAALSGIGAVAAFVYGAILRSQGCMNVITGDFLIWLVGIPALLLCVASLGLAIALFRGSIRAALIFDAIAVTAMVAGLTLWSNAYFLHGDYSVLSERLGLGAAVAAAALLFGAEAAWLLRVCRGRRSAWREFGLLAAVLALVAIAWPIASNCRHVRHVRALQDYVTTHLIAVPDGVPMTVTRSANSSGGHSDHICFRTERFLWGVTALHEGSAGWRLEAGDKAEVAWASAAGKTPEILSAEQARDYLRSVNVADRNIGTHVVAKKDAGGNRMIYVFDAPALGGTFEVTEFGNVHLHLSSPLAVADRLQ